MNNVMNRIAAEIAADMIERWDNPRDVMDICKHVYRELVKEGLLEPDPVEDGLLKYKFRTNDVDSYLQAATDARGFGLDIIFNSELSFTVAGTAAELAGFQKFKKLLV